MTSIFKNTYAVQDELSRAYMDLHTYPDIEIAQRVYDRIGHFAVAAANRNETVDWGTLTVTTRWDGLTDSLLISSRVNAE